MKSEKKNEVILRIYRARESLGVNLMRLDSSGCGDGYRICGPKLMGDDQTLKRVTLSVDDIDRLIKELRAAKKFLKVTP